MLLSIFKNLKNQQNVLYKYFFLLYLDKYRYIISVGGQQPDDISKSLTGKCNSDFIITRNGDEKEVDY